MIHKTKGEAIAACKRYVDALYEAQNKYGVHEENEDSSGNVYIVAKYFDENLQVKKYYHD